MHDDSNYALIVMYLLKMVAECRCKGDVPDKHEFNKLECMSLFYFRKYISMCCIVLALRN